MASSSVADVPGFCTAEEIVKICPWTRNVDGSDVYKLPLIHTGGSIVKRFSFGDSDITGKRRKTILLMGATGSGKTTMIHAMINFVLGVEWQDPFRFMLTDEILRGGSQAHNQTSEVAEMKKLFEAENGIKATVFFLGVYAILNFIEMKNFIIKSQFLEINVGIGSNWIRREID